MRNAKSMHAQAVVTERERNKEREREGLRDSEKEGEIERGCIFMLARVRIPSSPVRERERERGKERERCRIWLFLFLKGMTGALAPFSYLVIL